jgi:hypothetical protein
MENLRFEMVKSNQKRQPTQRAADKWESARFTGIFLASGLYCPQAESSPAHPQVTQTVGWHFQKIN